MHTVVADQSALVCSLLRHRVVYGLSGSLVREDERIARLTDAVGPVLFTYGVARRIHVTVLVVSAPASSRPPLASPASSTGRRRRVVDATAMALMSTANRIGIGLSEVGARQWNQTHHAGWRERNAGYASGDSDEMDLEQEWVAVYTDTYYGLDAQDPGDESQPNMVLKTLPGGPATLRMFLGPTVANCENADDQVDPHGLGVRFDFQNTKCLYNDAYCMRFGMDHHGGDHDCGLDDGQKVLEAIIGTSIVRGFKRRLSSVHDNLMSGDLMGTASSIGSLILDPLHARGNAQGFVDRGDAIGAMVILHFPVRCPTWSADGPTRRRASGDRLNADAPARRRSA